jgi:hypothetical protein
MAKKKTGAKPVPPALLSGAGQVRTIDIRFQGVCCFADAREGQGQDSLKRVLLPYDPRTGPDQHISYFEVAHADLDSSSGDLKEVHDGTHYGGGERFHTWELSEHRIVLPNAGGPPNLKFSTAFWRHVPQMKNNVHYPLPNHPHDFCFEDIPDSNYVRAYVDLDYGMLNLGPLANHKTKFTSKIGTSPFLERTPRYVVLQLPVNDGATAINLCSYKSGQEAWVTVKPGGTVTIANVRFSDIMEITYPDDPKEGFRLFYRLFPPEPLDPPLPEVNRTLAGFCSPSNWP